MKKIFPLLSAFLLVAGHSEGADKVLVEIKTNQGVIVLELDAKNAPITTKNFLNYVDNGFFTDTIFHRVIDNFMIQGGGFTKDFQQKKNLPPIKNEAQNGLKNNKGSIAMARTNDPHSATSQFFINVKDNHFLNYSASSAGYAVFGKVVEGMQVVDKIKDIPTGAGGLFPTDVPKTMVIIESIKRRK